MECQCELKPEERDVLNSIFRFILKYGTPPTIEQLQSSLKISSDKEIIRALDELEKKGDFLLRKKATQEIVSIYPLSLKPTDIKFLWRTEQGSLRCVPSIF